MHIAFVDLKVIDASKPFDGLAVGTFIDMYGRKVTFTPDDLDEYVKNTKDALEHTRTESGELVGLPIDAKDHENGDGAGWIIDIARTEDKLQFTPKWTNIGLDLIANNIRRFFSATVDIKNKVIAGGTLTNWPATRTKGRIQLRPIELANETLLAVNEEEYGTIDMLLSRLDALAEIAQNLVQPAAKDFTASAVTLNENTEVFKMDMTKEELAEFVAGIVKETMTQTPPVESADNPNADPAPAPPVEFNLEAFLAEGGTVTELENIIKEGIVAQYGVMQARAAKEAERLIKQARRENELRDLCAAYTGGSNEYKLGLDVEDEKLAEFMLGLSDKQLAFFTDLIQATLKNGLLDYSEVGHGKETTGVTPLPAEYATKLDSKEMTVEDLKNPVLGLGDITQYDLSAWQ